MNESERKQTDSAQQDMESADRAARQWGVVLRLLPWLVVALFLFVAFRIFR